MSWSPDDDATVIRLWNEGQSATEIAAELGGVTRSAVIGRISRMRATGIALRARPHKSRVPPKRMSPKPRVTPKRTAPKRRTAPKPAPVNRAPRPMNLPLLSLTDATCKWPLGYPAAFCGHGTKQGSPYCPHHHGCAYTVTTPG